MTTSPAASLIAASVSSAARAFGVTPRDIFGAGRSGRFAKARQVAIGAIKWQAADPSTISLPWLGRVFDRDHTTILHSLRLYAGWCEEIGVPLGADDTAARAALLAAHLGFHSDPHQEIHAMGGAIVDIHPRGLGIESRGYGDFELAVLDDLPESLWREAIDLALERAGELAGDQSTTTLLAAKQLGTTPAVIKHVLALPVTRHCVSDDAAMGEDASPMPRRASDDGFVAFAKAHIVGDGRGEVDVPTAFATYRRFCRQCNIRPAERGNFGFLMLRLAKNLGGVRSGDTITAIALTAATVAPRHEAVKTVPRLPPMPSAERCFVLPRASGLPAPSSDGDPARDDLEIFLEDRLVQLPGEVLPLEELKHAAASEGLSFRDILARARDRGHEVRRNPWGPDYLSDAILADGLSAS